MTDKDITQFDSSANQLTQEIIESNKPIKDLTYLFNEAQIKQSMLRAQKLSKLQDKVVDNVEKRIDSKPDNFTNAELLNAINILQKSNNDNLTYINSINEKPQIQLVNNSLNVSVDNQSFSKEERQRITDAVSKLLELAEQQKDYSNEPITILKDEDDDLVEEDNN